MLSVWNTNTSGRVTTISSGPIQEFFAGTNPNDSACTLFVTGAVSGTEFQRWFNTVVGKKLSD